ncbi:Rho GTPase activation protein [Entophlyctis helioformis]|nr:Rho GTPase activation protein [Entophlyctis helioformis]
MERRRSETVNGSRNSTSPMRPLSLSMSCNLRETLDSSDAQTVASLGLSDNNAKPRSLESTTKLNKDAALIDVSWRRKSLAEFSREELLEMHLHAIKRLNVILKKYGRKTISSDIAKNIFISSGSASQHTWWLAKKRDESGPKFVTKTHIAKSIGYASVTLDGSRKVPTIVFECGEFLKANCEKEGILRVSGNTARINILVNEFDIPPAYNGKQYFHEDKAHDVAGCLKKYLRDLPEPLLTTALYQPFLKCIDISDDADRILALQLMLLLLPPEHLHTFEYLCSVLAHIASKSDVNKMTAANLAACIAPSLLWPAKGQVQTPREAEQSIQLVSLFVERSQDFVVSAGHVRPHALLGKQAPTLKRSSRSILSLSLFNNSLADAPSYMARASTFSLRSSNPELSRHAALPAKPQINQRASQALAPQSAIATVTLAGSQSSVRSREHLPELQFGTPANEGSLLKKVLQGLPAANN